MMNLAGSRLPRPVYVGKQVMPSRLETNSLERRVKRLGRRYGVSLMKCEKPFGKVLVHGGYMLRDDDTRKIVFGAEGYAFSATLEEIENFLLAQSEEEGSGKV
jgi:hypothetical protein